MAASLAFAGCGLVDTIHELETLAELGIDDGASAGEATSALVTPDEELALELKTGAKLWVPMGAVDEEVELAMKRPEDKEALELIKSISKSDKAASAPYVLTPHGTQFKANVELTLPLAQGRDKKNIEVAWLEDEDDTHWKSLGVPEFEGDPAEVPEALSPAEQEVALEVYAGASNEEIARSRGVSSKTIGNQLDSIYRKLSVSSRVELVLRLRGRNGHARR